MRKTFLLLSTALLLGSSLSARAQYRGRGGNTSLGIKAGGSLTSYVGQDINVDYRFGFHAGVFANFGLSRLIAFQPELLYSQRGAKYYVVDSYERLHYVDVPLVFHVNTDGFFLEAGPQVGFLLGAHEYLSGLTIDLNQRYKTVDVGYLAGLGYQKKHGPGIGLRYNGGFTNIAEPTIQTTGLYQPRHRNSAFQLYVTYSFN